MPEYNMTTTKVFTIVKYIEIFSLCSTSNLFVTASKYIRISNLIIWKYSDLGHLAIATVITVHVGRQLMVEENYMQY